MQLKEKTSVESLCYKFFENQSFSTGSFPDLLHNDYIEECHAFEISQLQDSWSWRNLHEARLLAKILIDDQGLFVEPLFLQTIEVLKNALYSLGIERDSDTKRRSHVLNILQLFITHDDLKNALKRIFPPERHSSAQNIIRDSLGLHPTHVVTVAITRRAVFSALLTYLRQNVGSCFATAPAIMIQQEQPLQFLNDFGELLGTGRLTRIIDGVDYAVPLSFSWGVGDLFRPVQIASFGKNPLKTLSYSPGLTKAFEAIGLINPHASKREKRSILFSHLKGSGIDFENLFLPISADLIIKKILLKHFEVSQEALTEEKFNQGAFFQFRHYSAKEERVSRYFRSYEDAKKAFVSITDHALLKSWEFTLASLSESKSNFAKWNLFLGLGLQPEEPHGIGQAIYAKIQEILKSIQDEIEMWQSRYDHLFAQAQSLELRLKRASTEVEWGWVHAEYLSCRHEINRVLSRRDDVHESGVRLSSLYNFLVQFISEKVPSYFQEVYDAEIHEIAVSAYDDSPAGFRLLYKHGRDNPSLWNLIHTADEYLQSLASFFIAVESELNQHPTLKGIEKEVSTLFSEILITLKREEFLEASFKRLAAAYREPKVLISKNEEKLQRKPWVYISGGTMNTLIHYYYCNRSMPKEVNRWAENETELLAFLIDTVKELPTNSQNFFRQNSNGSLLAHSPTHAFLCKPGWKLFKRAWESDAYTYSWIREEWTNFQYSFLDPCILDPRMQHRLIEIFLFTLPSGYREILKFALGEFIHPRHPVEFKEDVMHRLSYQKWLKESALQTLSDELDNVLYRSLPLFPEFDLKERIERIFLNFSPEIKERIIYYLEKNEHSILRYQILTAFELREFAKSLLIQTFKQTHTTIDYHTLILDRMRELNYCYPEPFLIADSNWVNSVFGFVVNPGTGKIDFWRFDDSASTGRPMSVWDGYLNGSSKGEWGLYTAPYEYGQSI